MATPGAPRPSHTIDEWLALPAEARVELIDGAFVEKAAPTIQHAVAQVQTGHALAGAFARRTGGPWGPGGWWLATGHTLQALAAMHTLLAEMGSAAPSQTALRAHHVAYRACRVLKQPAQALEHFETVERIERQRAITQLRAQSELFVTRAEAQRADTTRAFVESFFEPIQQQLAEGRTPSLRELVDTAASQVDADPALGAAQRVDLLLLFARQ